MGDETFTKVEFLAAFNEFRTKAFKESTIRSAWRHTGLIPFDPKIVLAKVLNVRIDPLHHHLISAIQPFGPLLLAEQNLQISCLS